MKTCSSCKSSVNDDATECYFCGCKELLGELGKMARHSLVCPYCVHQAIYDVGEIRTTLTCVSCSKPFSADIVRVRSKNSQGNKRTSSRNYSIRVYQEDGREELVQFTGPYTPEVEARAKDAIALIYNDKGQISLIQNFTVSRYFQIRSAAGSNCLGCIIAFLLGSMIMACVLMSMR